MKVTLAQLTEAVGNQGKPGPLQKLVNVDEFCVGLKYRLAKLAIAVNVALEPFNTAHVALVEKHGTDNDKGGKSINADSDNWADFSKEYQELVAEEVELPVEPVILPPEADAKGVTSADLMALDGLVTVRGEDSPKAGPKEVVE